ncbi:hypothetical protein M5D96_011437 [Drosophila gunungcola]|uniref:Uncharacterized protein n=1 Tax=Drosophila gunungcola TaxID=103775 RepID=A0A9Q0BKC2_9MUSC|nr:hypothetical protein M5D96_011437 [Drosophila gunungcola]
MLPERGWNFLKPLASRLTSCVGSKGGCSKSNSESTSKSKAEPNCKRSAKKKNCSKVPTPFPSYSECKRKPTDPKPSKECDCWDFDKC